MTICLCFSAPKTLVSQRIPSTPDDESAQKKFAVMVSKQDKLLKGTFCFLRERILNKSFHSQLP